MKKKVIKKKKIQKVNWHRIIALSTAGQYIQNQLNDELKSIKLK